MLVMPALSVGAAYALLVLLSSATSVGSYVPALCLLALVAAPGGTYAYAARRSTPRRTALWLAAASFAVSCAIVGGIVLWVFWFLSRSGD